ncbi:MAG: hypothetical protein ACRD3M_18170 [Thermoanaerobaculia bacterium]
MQFTANEAQYVLATLLAQKKLRASQVRAALRWRREEIRKLREKLASLESLDGAAGASRRQNRSRRRRGARRGKLSPRVRSLRRLQGRYMGFVRRLKPAKKAKVRAVLEKRGLPAAIKLAASMTKKS